MTNTLSRQEALNILCKIQKISVKNGTDNMSMHEIDAEITVYRQEQKTILKAIPNDIVCDKSREECLHE